MENSEKQNTERLTAVWQNGGFSAKFNGSSSIELLCKTEHLCSDFRHFAKLQTVMPNAKRHRTTMNRQKKHRTESQRFVKLKEVQAITQSQRFCTTFNFTPTHPSPPTTQRQIQNIEL